MQIWLTIAALLCLILIGYFMHSLGQEQTAIATLRGLQDLKPVEKLTALRKLAEFETPFNTPTTLYDEYHQKTLEIHAIRDKIQNSYMAALDAVQIPF